MHAPWTVKTIHFMAERRRKEVGAFLNEPFIVSHFDPETSQADLDGLGPLPHIKCLGVVLLQVALGKTVKQIAQESIPEIASHDGILGFVDQAYVTTTILKDSAQTEDVPPALVNVINACMEPDMTFRANLGPGDTGGIRMGVWRELAAPLQDLVEGTYLKHPDVLEVTLPTVPQPVAQWHPSQSQGIMYPPRNCDLVSRSSQGIEEPEHYHAGLTMARSVLQLCLANISLTRHSTAKASSESWFEELDILAETLEFRSSRSYENGAPQYKQTSIAILDTGITPQSTAQHRVKRYEDFVHPGLPNRSDLTGHGTNLAELVVKAFPRAELYIGRVWEISTEAPNTKELMTKVSRTANSSL